MIKTRTTRYFKTDLFYVSRPIYSAEKQRILE